jgi:hypothetical protein
LIAYQANSLLYLETKSIKIVLLHAHYYISVSYFATLKHLTLFVGIVKPLAMGNDYWPLPLIHFAMH